MVPRNTNSHPTKATAVAAKCSHSYNQDNTRDNRTSDASCRQKYPQDKNLGEKKATNGKRESVR